MDDSYHESPLSSSSPPVPAPSVPERATRRCTGADRAGSGAAGVPSSRQRRTTNSEHDFPSAAACCIRDHSESVAIRQRRLRFSPPRSRHVCAPSSVVPTLYRMPENSLQTCIISIYVPNGTYSPDTATPYQSCLLRTHPAPRCNCLPKEDLILYVHHRTDILWFYDQIVRAIIDTCNERPSMLVSAVNCDVFPLFCCHTETL